MGRIKRGFKLIMKVNNLWKITIIKSFTSQGKIMKTPEIIDL